MPLAASELLWDRDIQTPGDRGLLDEPGRRAGRSRAPGSTAHSTTATRRASAPARSSGGRAIRARFAFEASLAYWSFDPRKLFTRTTSARTRPGSRTASRPSPPSFTSPTCSCACGSPSETFPSRSPSTASTTSRAGAGATTRLREPSSWPARSALPATGGASTPTSTSSETRRWAPTTPTTGGTTPGIEGHRLGVAWTFLPRVYLQGSFSIQRRLDAHFWVNRYLVDVVKMF